MSLFKPISFDEYVARHFKANKFPNCEPKMRKSLIFHQKIHSTSSAGGGVEPD